MKKTIFLFVLSIMYMGSATTMAQSIEESPTILYMKANVLYESGRYDEAIRMYNRILNNDENYVNAYVMRGKAKYALGAYRGTKNDMIDYIKRAGVTKDVINIMLDTELQLDNTLAAKNYASTVLEMDPYEPSLYLKAGDIAVKNNEKNQACEYYATGSSLGDKKCSDAFSEHCHGYVVKVGSKTTEPSTTTTDNEDEGELMTPIKDVPDVEVEKSEEANLNAQQKLTIDESLDIIITHGLGDRSVDSQPDIFIISAASGEIAVNICVDRNGKVISANVDSDRTSLGSASMRSLAVRKAKEFLFAPSLTEEQCGRMIFMIKA